MRFVIVASTLCGLVAAAPKPQNINIAAIQDLPTPSVLGPAVDATTTPAVTYNPTVAAASAAAAISTDPAELGKRAESKREACAKQPTGKGPVPGDGSVSAYLDPQSVLSVNAQNAKTPSGYVNAFTNFHGSTQQIGYLTYKTIDSGDYDVVSCAASCDQEKFCLGFNIYYERDPSVDPSAASCANPTPTTNVICSLYGYSVAVGSATNEGQWRGSQDANGEAFHVVIAGSNGYSKLSPSSTPQTQANFTGPVALDAAINAPLDNGYDTYTGMKLYNSGPFDTGVCAAACQAQTAYDRATAASDGTYKACNFFNAYILTKNDVPQGTYCSFYTRVWNASYAVNTGYYFGSDVYSVKSSFAYALSAADPGHV